MNCMQLEAGDWIGDHSLAQTADMRLEHVNVLGLLSFLYPFYPLIMQ